MTMSRDTQTPPIPGRPFVARRTVRFGHCDPAGIVYFPRYYELLNGVVEDWWDHLGLPWTGLIGERRIGMPTAQLDARFVAPSFLGERLDFELRVAHLGRSSLQLEHRVVGPAGDERVRFAQRIVATSLDTHRPIAWPEDLREALQRFKETP
jgi:4-hydroxybenzoyl-CoA thioesterase